MDRSGGEPEEGEEELGAVFGNIGMIGVKPVGVEDVLKVGGTGGTSFGFIDVGDDSLHGLVPVWGLAQGGQTYYRETAPEDSGKKLAVSPIVCSNAGGGV